MNSIKKYIKKHKITKWFFLISVLIVIIIIIIHGITGFNYKIVDYFTDSNANQKFVFMFVEVNRLEDNKIKSAAKEIIQNHIIFKNRDISEQMGILIHFYKKSDIALVPSKMHSSLKKKFPQDKNIENNLRYVADGRIYMKFTSKNKIANDRDTLMKSEMIIPREGVKAKDVMRRGTR